MIFTFLLLSTLANGLFYYLWNNQLIEPHVYRDYLAQLNAYLGEGEFENFQAVTHGLFNDLFIVPNTWLITKVFKDVLFVIFAVISMYLIQQNRFTRPQTPLLPKVLLAWVLLAFAISTLRYGLLPPVLGIRQFLFLTVVFLGAWVCTDDRLQLLSRYLFLLLVIQLVLACYENFNSFGLFHSMRIGNRVTGTFTYPTSLGIFAAVAFTFIASFSQINKRLVFVPAAILVYLSGSGTGFVLLLVAICVLTLKSLPNRQRRWLMLALLPIIATAIIQMPQALSRPTLYDSIFGRIQVAENYLKRPKAYDEFWVGHGLGVGSNVLNSLKSHSSQLDDIDIPHAPADSTPMALVHQMGLIGLILFYGMLVHAAWRDRKARLVYAVLGLASLTVNLTELYPVNFLLGLILCRSYFPELTESDTEVAAVSKQGHPPEISAG